MTMIIEDLRQRHDSLFRDLHAIGAEVSSLYVEISSRRQKVSELEERRREIMEEMTGLNVPKATCEQRKHDGLDIVEITIIESTMLVTALCLALEQYGLALPVPEMLSGACSYEIPAGRCYECEIHNELEGMECLLSEPDIFQLGQFENECGIVYISSMHAMTPYRLPRGETPSVLARSRSTLYLPDSVERPVNYLEYMPPGRKILLAAPRSKTGS